MGKKQQKSKAISLTFRPFLASFAIFGDSFFKNKIW
jgi:hypothetical protein